MPATDMFPYHENFEMHRKRLAITADALGKHGIRLGVSFLAAPSHRSDKNYQFIYEADALATLVKSVSSRYLGLILDTWNWHFGGGSPEPLRALGADRIIAVRIADAPSDAVSDSVRDEQRTLPQEVGTVPNAALLTALVELGFKGPVSIEPHPSHLTGLNRETIVQRISGCLDELLKAAGMLKATPKPALTAID